jgi:hypothetical protein
LLSLGVRNAKLEIQIKSQMAALPRLWFFTEDPIKDLGSGMVEMRLVPDCFERGMCAPRFEVGQIGSRRDAMQ